MDTLNDYNDESSSSEASTSSHLNHSTAPNNSLPPQQPSSQRLNHIRMQQQQQQSSSSWIQQLQSQPEFHNPHFFQSVVEHFGIDPFGTHVVKSKRNRKQPTS
jgi:hypothetical protein